jgi:hypothetical protein
MNWILATGLLGALALPQAAAADPAPPNASYFANCLASSVAGKTFYRNGRYLTFVCYGYAAQDFFAALGRRPADVAYEEQHADGVFRFTDKPEKDTSGLDYCRRSEYVRGKQEYLCALIYPAGSFLGR